MARWKPLRSHSFRSRMARWRILQGAQLQALSRVGQADLGWVGGTWRLESFVLGAQSVVFASDFRVEVLGDSCGDGYLKMWDYCEQYLKHSWPWSQSFFDHVKDMGAPNVSQLGDRNLLGIGVRQFTTVIFAQHTLRLTTRSRVLSGLAFFCAGDELVLEDSSAIISKGRGCPAGEGAGAGELRTHFGECGGAGASNAGAGGDGALRLKARAQLAGAELWHCAEKGLVAPPQPGLLPLFGASGGGCCSCPPNTRLEYSSGGGALWLSSSVLSLGRSSLISADGLPGGMVPGPQVMTNPGMVASGGGAGGQILISIKDLKLLAPAPLPETTATTTDPGGAPEDEGDQPPKLTATGGAAQCISARKSVGGAGGGGFIGLWWRSLPSAPGKGGKGRKHRGATTHEELEDRVTLDVSGGPLTETCEDVLPQQLHQDLDQLPAGNGPPTTQERSRLHPVPPTGGGRCRWSGDQLDHLSLRPRWCLLRRLPRGALGRWRTLHELQLGGGRQTVAALRACALGTNKPNPSAFYVRNAWPNASCPYYCALGVPEVVINPKCLSNYAFAASFFGGEMGFWSFLLCPVSIFLILRTAQWLRRKRKRTLGRWQFPREELPCHLGRIFLLGDNSPGSPWRLPHMSTTGAAAQAAQALAPEGWQMRRARARRAERAVRLLRGELTLWKDAGDDGSKPCIKFDCDDSATTGASGIQGPGYLDLFDFRRSGMDWAPGNLKEEQILVAQGAGSWARPYELNVGDPLLLGVAQSQGPRGPIGSHLIYSLVCTFNLFSRLVPTQENGILTAFFFELLEALWDGEAPALTLLQSEVEKAARSLSLPAAVQVQIFRMSRGPRAGPGGEDAASAAQSPDSFTDLVHPVPLAPAPATRCPMHAMRVRKARLRPTDPSLWSSSPTD
eukprot:g17631.t2